MSVKEVSANAHSWELAETALRQIKALDLPANPESFEVLCTYASGVNPPLNDAINNLLNQQAQIFEADIRRLFDTFLSSRRFVERLNTLTDELSEEIERVEKNITESIASAGALDVSIGSKIAGIDQKKTQEELTTLIEAVMLSTKEFQRINQIQTEQLRAAEKRTTSLQQSIKEIRQESVTDSLTQLANRRHFDAILADEVAKAQNTGVPLALLFCDIDHFKKYNDQYGHRTGDHVLRFVATTMKKHLRDTDLGARYGGEELVAILTGTSLEQAKEVGERIRHAIENTEVRRRGTNEKLSGVTISVGVASLHQNDTPEQLVERADACLYVAKNAGRNRTIAEDALP